MHPVIEHIFNRRNQSVPQKDGRKIALVLYGGIMVGVRGAGALVAMEQLGLTRAFDEIYTMSSGFLNASYFLARQMKSGAAAYYTDLTGAKFLNLFRFWKIADIKYMMEVITKLRPINTPACLANPTKLYDMLINSRSNQAEYLEIHQHPQDFLNIVRASALLPFVAHGDIKIGQDRYHDILKDHNLPDLLKTVINSGATDILVIYNYSWQKNLVCGQVDNIEPQTVFQFCPLRTEGQSVIRQKLRRFNTDPKTLKNDCLLWAENLSGEFGNKFKVALE